LVQVDIKSTNVLANKHALEKKRQLCRKFWGGYGLDSSISVWVPLSSDPNSGVRSGVGVGFPVWVLPLALVLPGHACHLNMLKLSRN